MQLQQVRGNQNVITLLKDRCGLAQHITNLGCLRPKGIFTPVEAVFHGPALNSHKKACECLGDRRKPSMGGTGIEEVHHYPKARKRHLSCLAPSLTLNKSHKMCGEEWQVLSLSGHRQIPIFLWEGKWKQTFSVEMSAKSFPRCPSHINSFRVLSTIKTNLSHTRCTTASMQRCAFMRGRCKRKAPSMKPRHMGPH